MNEQLIDFKLSEYTGRLGMAFYHKKDFEKAKKLELTALLLLRCKTRAVISRKLAITEELQAARRSLKKMSQAGITFPLGEQRAEKLTQDLKEARKELADIGNAVVDGLDLWQILGATLYDLCNLCNRSYAQVLQEMDSEHINRNFSALVYIYDLDYKSTRKTIDLDEDAPLTHAVLAYVRDQMINTAAGRKAAHRATEKCFPGLMENALTMVTDEDGKRYLINKDGEIVGTVDGEDNRKGAAE